MGNATITTHNLKIIKVDGQNNLILVKGNVPGAEGGYLVVKTSLKKGTRRKWKAEGGQAAKVISSQESKPKSSEA